jgi:L-2-hydroxyglutarate oxidase LhgO
MTIDRMECVVVGAGTAGAAVARRLAIAGHQVMLIARRGPDADDGNGLVPGAGWPEPVEPAVLDQPETLRAVLRARGSAALKSYCEHSSTPYSQTGQLVVARSDDEWETLAELKSRIDGASASGQCRAQLLDADAVLRLEPGLKCVGALLIEDAGIVDGDTLRLNLRIDAENRGAFVTEDSRLVAAYPMGRGFELDLAGLPGELTTLRCEILVNAAEEVESYQIACRIGGMKEHLPVGLPPVAGKRYHLDGTAPFRLLVVPSCQDANAAALFYPGFRGDSWMDVSPVRDENADLEIQTPASHGIRGLINVFGMDARSETSVALALADAIIDGLAERSQKHLHPVVTNKPGKLVMA